MKLAADRPKRQSHGWAMVRRARESDERGPTLDEMRERLATYPPAIRDFFPDVVHEHPFRFLWHYRVRVVRTITLKEIGLR
jgi:hypothetical protein